MTLTQPQKDLRFRNVGALIVKVTYRCNLDCLYCYENVSKKGDDMTLETFKNLADKTLESTSEKEILFLFHGGEPTLLKNEWYEESINYAIEKAQSLGRKAKFSMQTNLLGLNPAKIELFKKYNIHLGISFDGIAEKNQTMRGGESKVFDNYICMKKLGIQAGILTTINHSNYDKFAQICDFMVNQAKVNFFKANVVTSVGRGYNLPNLEADKIFEAQKSILDFMIETEGKVLLEHNLVVEIERFFENRESLPKTLCHEKVCGAGKTVLGVTPQGNILPCGRFQWNDKDYFLGELESPISEEHLQDFEAKVSQFHSLVPSSWYDCDTCEAKKICSFACQAFIVRSKAQANVDCLPTKMRYQYFVENQEKLQVVYEEIKKLNHKEAQTKGFRIKDKNGGYKTFAFPKNEEKTVVKKKKKLWKLTLFNKQKSSKI